MDSTGVYLTGHTQSGDFPTANPLQPTLQGWRNAFVTKINVAGNALVYSTYLGGGEDDGWGIAVDSTGNAHVRGDTRSRNFPVVNAIQPVLRSRYYFNCFVSELNADGSALLYSTYWGGSGADGGIGIAVDSTGNTYVAGRTTSADFPTKNAIQPNLAGATDTFMTKFSPDGQTVIYSTFLGGSADEWELGATVDLFGSAYLVGYTQSTDFPMVNAAQPTYAGGTDAFVAKINAAGNALVYSTYLGGTGEDQATGVAADLAGNAFVVGFSKSGDFPVAQAIQTSNHGGQDAFATEINADGRKLLYSTYLGGTSDDGQYVKVAVDSVGAAYITGMTWSIDFPVTGGVFQSSLKGAPDAFVVKLAADTTPPVITLAASPRELWPPNGNMVPVTISGTITDSGSGVKAGSARYTLRDEYELLNSNGAVTLDSAGNFSFTTLLRASREGYDLNGRVYTIRISAKDNAGNRGAKSARVLVPHNH